MWIYLLQRFTFRAYNINALVLEVVLQLHSLQLFHRIPRLAEERLSRGRVFLLLRLSEEQIGEFEKERAERLAERQLGGRIAITKGNVMPNWLQRLYRAAVRAHGLARLALFL